MRVKEIIEKPFTSKIIEASLSRLIEDRKKNISPMLSIHNKYL
jgi:hypothetical protein